MTSRYSFAEFRELCCILCDTQVAQKYSYMWKTWLQSVEAFHSIIMIGFELSVNCASLNFERFIVWSVKPQTFFSQ